MSQTFNSAAHTTLGVTNVSQTALAADRNRKTATFVNDSANNIYLTLGTPATTDGILIVASGGSYEINHVNRYTGIVTAISDVAGPSNLRIMNAPA